MNQKLLAIVAVVVLVVVVAVALIFGQGLFTTEEATVTNGDIESAPVVAVDPDQPYTERMAPVLQEFTAWRNGPIAERAVALEAKMENAGALSNLTYGNLLLLYLKAQASGKTDVAMDWVVQETIAPTLQPIYERIISEGQTLSVALNANTPPDEVAEHQQALLQCIDFEVTRSQTIVDVLTGVNNASVPERTTDPCTGVEANLEAMEAYVAAN